MFSFLGFLFAATVVPDRTAQVVIPPELQDRRREQQVIFEKEHEYAEQEQKEYEERQKNQPAKN